jgi:exosortase A-associated hydrolase 1
MTLSESPLRFDCGASQLIGILAGAAMHSDLGVVIVVGGPQYRAGAHRQFVALARALAEAGFPALRFDHRGMGDSEGEQRSFEDIGTDIACAIDALQRAAPGVRRVVLWGLCDGASAALLYLQSQADPRVAGLALLNPWVRSEASLAKTHVKHYYRQRLQQREFWLKLISGGVALQALAGLAANLRQAFGRGSGRAAGAGGSPSGPYQDRMAQAWGAFRGEILLMLSEHDYTAREFSEYTAGSSVWQQALKTRPAARVDIRDADHTCSQPQAQRAVEAATADWLARAFRSARVPT